MQIERTAKTLGEFLNRIGETRELWQVKDRKELWFRGEGRDYKDTRLRPALYRPSNPNALKSPSDLIDIEDDLFAHFRHNSTELARRESASETAEDPWEDYFLMQQYGGPTRLLDWSDGALIALHFALREDHDPQNPEHDRKVYVLDPHWLVEHIEAETNDHESTKKSWAEYCRKYSTKGLDEDEWEECYLPDSDGHSELPVPNLPLVLEFDHFVRRVSAQRSRFILMGSAPDFFNRLMDRSDTRIATITVDASSVARTHVELRDSGITESVIFPDLDGLGRELKQLWAERLREPS
jgi:hypothetical protein